MYKIETHLHTKYTSRCGRLDAEEIVSGYLSAGYHGIVITDHYNRDTFRMKGIRPDSTDALDAFLEGYHRVMELGRRRGLAVYRGAELRFDGDGSDFLLYGWHDALLQNPEAVMSMGLPAFAPLYRADGALMIQAHPYRSGCTPADPKLLDGVEVRNMHPGHESRNWLAKDFAVRNGLLETSGSDCHERHHLGRGGILTEELPADDAAFVRLLRSRNFRLLGS